MAIEAQLFDGTILEFPDGTDSSVISGTARRLTMERQKPAEPAYDPMTGLQVTGIAPAQEKLTKSVLEGTTAPSDTLPTGEYLPSAGNPLQRAYDVANPAERERLASVDPRFKQIHDYYTARDTQLKDQQLGFTPTVSPTLFDTRLEARKQSLMEQGLAPDFAESTAKRMAATGQGKMTPYGEVKEAPPEYQIEQDYRLRPEMTGIEETGRVLKRAGAKAGAGILQGGGGINRFIGDMLGVDTTDTTRTLDNINRYTQAIGEPASKPVAILEGAITSIAQQLPALAGSVITESEIPVLASMFAQSFGQTYDQSKRLGMDTTDSTIRSGLYASFEVLGEKFGLGDTLKGIKAIAKDIPTKDLSTYFAKALAKEIPGEQLTYAGQFAVDKGYGVNPEAGFKDFFDGAANTLAATVVQGGMMLGGGAGAQQAMKYIGAAKKPEEPQMPKTYQELVDRATANGMNVQDPEVQTQLKTFWEATQGTRNAPETPPVETTPVMPPVETAPVTMPAETVAEAPVETIQAQLPESMSMDVEKQLAELTSQEVQKGVKNPASPEGQVLENIERKQTATPQFQEWFGSSQVKDSQGKPLVVYHGTTQDIKTFDPSKSFGNLGVSFFSEDPKFASSYDYTQGKGNVIPVYLSANNIFDFGNKQQRDSLKEAASKIEIRDPVRGFTTLDTKIPDSEQYFDTEHPEVFQLIKDLGFDGVKLKERGVTNYAVFNPANIKSSIGNTGAYSRANNDIAENIERLSTSQPVFQGIEERAPSLRIELNRLKRLFDSDRISPDVFTNQAISILDQSKTERVPVPRKRGQNIILEKMNAAVRKGELDQQAVDFASWFINRNPSLVEDLSISIKQAKEGSPSGSYQDLSRLMTLYKGSGNSETAVHEILHHTERMMPEAVQMGIRKLWLKRLSQAAKKADKGTDNTLKTFFKNLLDYHLGGNTQLLTDAKSALNNGSVDYSNYQYTNPSEFWAVNATDIMAARFEGDKSFIGKLKQWLREFAQKAKSVFGLDSNAPIINALNSLSKADGKFQSQKLISEGRTFESIKRRTFKDKAGSQVVSEEKTPEMYKWTSPEDSLVLGFSKDSLLRNLVNKNIDTKRIQDAIKKEGKTIDDQFNVEQKETLYHGKVAGKTKDFLLDEVMPIINEMHSNKITLEQIQEYLHMRHAKERNDKMNEINKGNASLQDQGSGVHTDVAKKYFENLSKEDEKKLDAIAKRIDNIITGTQEILVNSGAEERSLIETWRKTYENYVPLFREDDDFVSPPGTGLGQGFGIKGSFSKQATGSTKKVSDILANVIAQRERAIVRGEKIKVGQALYGLVLKNPNPNFWFAYSPDAVKSKKAAIQELNDLGINDPEYVLNLIDAPRTPYVDKLTGQVGYRINTAILSQPNVFPVRINGKDRYVFFSNKDPRAAHMVATLRNMDVETLHDFENFIGKGTHWIAAVNTQYNPIFGVVNLVRDVKGAMYNLSSTELKGHQKEVASHIMSSMRGIAGVMAAERNGTPRPNSEMAKMFIQFREDGGQTGYRDMLMRRKEEEQLISEGLRKLTDNKAKKMAQSVLNQLSDFNDIMENSVRLAAYKTALDNGMSRDQAANLAKNLTVNFDRKGLLSRRINTYFAFFNAAVQGSARIYETLSGPAGKKIMAGGVGIGVMQAVMMAAAGFADDDPPEFIRERNFVIPVGGKKYVSIPYPLGFHVFPGIGRITTDFVLNGGKNPTKALLNIASTSIDAFNPLGGTGIGWQTITPTVAKPFVQIGANKDSFGRPIFRDDRATKPTPGYLRSRETASSISKFLAETLNFMSGGTKYQKGLLSPTADEIDYLAGQVTGGVGRELAKTKDVVSNLITGEETPTYRIPLLGRFYGDVDSNASQANTFYNNVVKMSNFEQEIKGRQAHKESTADFMKDNPSARLWQRANSVENQITALKKERKELYEKDASKDQIKRKTDQMISVMRNFNQQVSNAEK